MGKKIFDATGLQDMRMNLILVISIGPFKGLWSIFGDRCPFLEGENDRARNGHDNK
jgi:hypothetical protein